MDDERLLAFTRAFCDSVRSGLPPGEALRELSLSHGRRLATAADAVGRGEPLHAALAPLGLLPPLLLALMRAGEESGKLDAFLDRFAAALESKLDFKRRLRRALVYPAFAASLAGALFIAFSAKAGPLLLEPLLEAGVTMPEQTLLLTRASRWVLAHWPRLLAAAALAWAAAGALLRSPLGRACASLASHCVPGARFATEHGRHYRFESALELLLAAGLRPRQIVELLEHSFADDPVTRARLRRAAALLAEGKSFSQSLGACLPEEDLSRVALAEKAGRLDEALAKLAAGHRDRQLDRLRLTATAVQLTTVVALAPVCWALIMSIVMPALSAVTAGLAQAGAQAPSQPPPRAAPRLERAEAASLSASRFNETHGARIADYMRARAPRPADAGAEPGAAARPAPTPKLKARAPLHRTQFTSVEPTAVRGSLD